MDNGTEFLYNVNRDLALDERQRVVNAAWELYRTGDTPRTTHPLSHDSSYVSYIMELKNDADGTSAKYYCSVIYIEKNHTFLEVLLAAPLQDLLDQISRQRFLFLGIITLALIAIWIFAWIFTGKLLDPIEANRLRQNQFIASASHELRTPLAVILSCAETELAKKESPELSTIKSESLRTSRLLGDMLTLLSCDTGHLEIKPVSTQLDTLVLNACEAFETMAAARHIRITAVLPEDILPDCLCDSERITQVLAVFLHNAISYTPEGGSITLSVRHCSPHHRSGRHFEIQISDTGVGISDEEKNRIFDRFYRSEKARSDKDHFGLGLSIAHDIITAHHGSITVTDTPGGGTTFIITI